MLAADRGGRATIDARSQPRRSALRIRSLPPPALSDYFQPASASQALRSVAWVFSHWVIDWVSLSLILLFMQVQYLVITSTVAFSFLLSWTHWDTHLASSGPASTGVVVRIAAAHSKPKAKRFINHPFWLRMRKRTAEGLIYLA